VFEVRGPAKRSCEANFLEWGGGLTHHVMQGRGDGAFDYDPEDPLIDRIEGEYDLETGDFHWTTTHAEGGFRTTETAEGYGTLWRDGDLEIAYDLTVQYADGSERTWQVQTERYGCSELTRTEDPDGRVEVVESTWGDEQVAWVREWIWGPLAITGEGSRNALGEQSEAGKVKKKERRYRYDEATDVEGRTVHTFDGDDGVRQLKGHWARTRDGVVTMRYTSQVDEQSPQEWEYTVDGKGAGDGTWTWGEDTCELRFRKFRCERKSCTAEAFDGECRPPVDFPAL